MHQPEAAPATKRDWHASTIDELVATLATDLDAGLTSAEAESRLKRIGRNETDQQGSRPLTAIVAAQLTDLMILILLAAAVVSGLLGEIGDMITIAVIVLLNAIVGSTQEYRAERALAALRSLSALQASVVRDGKLEEIDAARVVPGDLVRLEAGDVVPAEIRLVDTTELVTDESALTGESATVDKRAGVVTETELPIGDLTNMAFKSTLVTKGRGSGIVAATGRDTEIGRIASLLARQGKQRTPLQQRLARFSQKLAVIVLGICALVFVLGLLRGEPVGTMFLVAMSLAVAAVPEALPAVVAVSLALGARTLSRHRSLARRLPAVEALGSVTYICADKTGTLTENRMTVARVLAPGNGERLADLEAPLGQVLGTAMALCNDIGHSSDVDPTELALVSEAASIGLEKPGLLVDQPLVQTYPFDSDRKLMATLHETADGRIAYVKGAPEALLERCTTSFDADTGGGTALDRQRIHAEAGALAAEGYRVLAFALRKGVAAAESLGRDELESELTFLGLVALHDPIRQEVPQAIDDCRTAGIAVVMITGDHPSTARHIARSIGLLDGGSELMTGQELRALSDEELGRRVPRVKVYARVDPEQKIRIVEALQANGEYVAMTGDGVNDAPALRQATIGVAMGQRGTDVARETSDLVLLDDNFATIAVAIREGRRVYDNIRKFVRYTMTSNTGEICVLLAAPLLLLPLPLLPIHILWINLVTDGLPGLALSVERGEADLMRRPPRPPHESVFAQGLWKHMLWIGLLLAALSLLPSAWIASDDQAYWQTMVFSTLVFAQLFQALSLRSETQSIVAIGLLSNRFMAITIVLSIAAQLVVIYLPFANLVMHTAPLSARDLVLSLLLGFSVVPIIEAQKWWGRRGASAVVGTGSHGDS